MADDIRQWLEELGLGKYAELFLENEIRSATLPHLEPEDLKELGLPLGPRKTIMAAIPELGKTSANKPAPKAAKPRSQSAEAERRQLTIVFCDLVGSTALSGRLDPEDMRDVLRRFQDVATDIIVSHEGHVANYIGDAVLAYFGWPRALEDQAAQAVRAGLAAIEAISQVAIPRSRDERIAARIGISTGLVVVGDLIGERASQLGAAVGETPNLASRLQAIAEPGQVLIGEMTQRLLGSSFDLVALGRKSLKGVTTPQQVWRVRHERPSESRFDATHDANLTPFVGRDHELGLLLKSWGMALDNEGQAVLLSGEAGIGKSRLMLALQERIRHERHVTLRFQCSPYHSNLPFFPVIRHLERAARFTPSDDGPARLLKLESLLGGAGQDAHLLAAMLSLPFEQRYGPLEMSPDIRKRRTVNALTARILKISGQAPVLFLFEDAHWIDSASEELLREAVARIAGSPVLMLVTHRPEWQSPLATLPRITTLSLGRLPRKQGAQIVQSIVGMRLQDDIVARIVSRTDGVPLFIEELTKALVERAVNSTDADIPPTLHASLAARLDQLPPEAREVAQIAAVIGRDFDQELLAEIACRPEAELVDCLEHLLRSELVSRASSLPQTRYSFKHALVQDAAYNSLLHSTRQNFHRQIALILERKLPENGDTELSLIAHHFEVAGLEQQAIGYYLSAARQAIMQATYKEAVSLISRALRLLEAQPRSPENQELELSLHITIGPALMAVQGYGSPEVERTYSRAFEICQQLGRSKSHDALRVMHGLRRSYTHSGNYHKAQTVSEDCLSLALKIDDKPMVLDGHYSLGCILLSRGDLVSAEPHLSQGTRLGDDPEYFDNGFSSQVAKLGPVCQGFLAHTLWARGYPTRARNCSQASLSRAKELNHRFTEAHVEWQFLMSASFLRDAPVALKHAEATISVAREYGYPLWIAWSMCLMGWAQAEQGELDEGIETMRQGLAASLKVGSLGWRPYFLALQAIAHDRKGQANSGLRIIGEAIDLAKKTGEHCHLAELHRCRGVLLLSASGDSHADAEASLLRALEIAQTQKAKSWELRAAMSLAHLWADRGNLAKAKNLLRPIRDWFSEGYETADLKAANALLEELA